MVGTHTRLEKEHLFEARLLSCAGTKCEIHNEGEANDFLKRLEGATYTGASVKKSEKRRNPAPPFITSTLQQEASRKLGFDARRTMTVAQQLYEGLDLGPDGHVGLITYMRTDSTRVAREAQDEAREYITRQYGASYVPETPRQVSKKGAQDAHEAIRPTSVNRHPDAVKEYLSSDQYRLYRLIWQRFVASQMMPAVFDVVSVDISAADMIFRATGSTVKLQGFMKVYTEGKDDARVVAAFLVSTGLINPGDRTGTEDLGPVLAALASGQVPLYRGPDRDQFDVRPKQFLQGVSGIAIISPDSEVPEVVAGEFSGAPAALEAVVAEAREGRTGLRGNSRLDGGSGVGAYPVVDSAGTVRAVVIVEKSDIQAPQGARAIVRAEVRPVVMSVWVGSIVAAIPGLAVAVLLAVAAALGLQRLQQEEPLRHDFARATLAALGRPLVRVDVEAGAITF